MKKWFIAGALVSCLAASALLIWMKGSRTTYCRRCHAEFTSRSVSYEGHKGERLARALFCEEVDGHVLTDDEAESASMVDWKRIVNGPDQNEED